MATSLAARMAKLGGSSEDAAIKTWVSTNYPPLNLMLSGRTDRGLPCSRLVEIYGPSGSGKTWLSTQLMVSAQEAGGIAIFMDHEYAFNLEYAQKLGLSIDEDKWAYAQPPTLERSITMACDLVTQIRKDKMIAPDAPIIVVFDSIAAMVPKSVFEKGIDEHNMNDTTARSRSMSAVLPVCNRFVCDNNALFLFLNQIRTKPGVVYGDPMTTPGGVSMEFFASVRLALGRKLTKEEADGGGKEVTGQIIGITTKKNRITRPFQEQDVLLRYNDVTGTEFDRVAGLVQTLVEEGAIPYSKPRLTWTDGKQYFTKAFIDKVKTEGLYDELVKMYCALHPIP